MKTPVKTADEAFRISCEKNGIEIKERKKCRKSMRVRDDNNDVYIIYDTLSIKKAGKKPCFRKLAERYVLSKRISMLISAAKKHSGLLWRNVKGLTKA